MGKQVYWYGETNSIYINGLADKVYCTFNGKDATDKSSAKIAFYDDSNKLLYETGYYPVPTAYYEGVPITRTT